MCINSRNIIITFRVGFLCSLLYKNVKIEIYRTIILPVVLYGCESWLTTMREECRLRVFEKYLGSRGIK
jgi:hypothetical protein